jgi:hypothetical protein
LRPISASPRGVHSRILIPAFLLFLVLQVGSLIHAEPIAISDTTLQKCRTIALAMFQYAHDHDGKCPDGKSSTEVFQKLADGHYLTVPDFYYIALPGKQHQLPGEPLRPENVSYDVTGGATLDSAGNLPLVFLTGYRVEYKPGGKAVSLTAPCPPFQIITLKGPEADNGAGASLIATYANLIVREEKLEIPSNGYGEVLNFVPGYFDAHGQTFRQLTPTGVLK